MFLLTKFHCRQRFRSPPRKRTRRDLSNYDFEEILAKHRYGIERLFTPNLEEVAVAGKSNRQISLSFSRG